MEKQCEGKKKEKTDQMKRIKILRIQLT